VGKAWRITPILSFVNQFVSCKGDLYLETCAQRTLGAEDFLCLGLHAGAAAGFLSFSFVYIPFGVRDGKTR
jgi:hypothetical protein